MTMSVRHAARHAVVVLGVMTGLGAVTAQAQEDQAQQFTPEFREVHKSFDPKHTPKIVAPDSVKRGEWFTVTVSVGAGSPHPSLQEHFVRYIALYKDTVEIARAYLHPVYSSPTVTFTVALDEGGALRAVAEPTHSSAWEATRKITVVP
jgi:superoxide reductase